MGSGYSRNQGGYGVGGGYGGGMRNMGGYGGPSHSRPYMNDRMGGRSMGRGQLPRKRLPQRSPASGPRSKRPNIESDRHRDGKSRRHRDSRGDSKGRHTRSEEEEDDTYNPEEPTEDISDAEYESFDLWKCSDDDGEVVVKAEPKQNGEQEESAEGADKTDEAATKKVHLCYVCKVKCSTKEVLVKHNNSKTHVDKIEELLTIRREKKDGTSDDKKDDDHDRKKLSRKPGNWCTVCECAFNGNFLAHRRTKEHRKKRDKKYPKCRPCRMGFSSSEEYRDHYKSEDHKQKSAEFHYLKNLASGSDEDEAAIEPVKIKEEEYEEVEKMEEETEEKAEIKEDEEAAEDQEKNEEGADEKEKDGEEKKEDKEEKKEVKKPKPREPRSVGQSFVISVQGYYCKLCHKFFKDATVAKSKHCRSIMHTEAFKKAMEEAIEQEEERQKQAEEQDKLDKEAQEAAERQAEIAAIERAARDAIRKEAAAKKAGTKKDEDVEMKDVSEDTPTTEAQEEKEDVAEPTPAENGSKEEAIKEEPEAEETKEVAEEKPKEAEAVKEEQPEEEQEEEAKEVTSSPATRRGRGRGRGRKRR
ncbi:hypothetical protein JTE90_029094 [Oedothorax gibbosus]|uniref:Matrin-type domain-containing protein n=1 Tax=Oedothorax gibbosus TaxID=931172 RepID=A0AAV6V9F1_9ARAC|nr:hypothetical protein JTE90_029094 [Oedothorax gibbosus]